MLRIVLLGVGVVTTALVGYFSQRQLSRVLSQTAHELPALPIIKFSGERVKKTRRTPMESTLDNGEDTFGPMA